MRNEKITPLYERLSRDDELQGESNSIAILRSTPPTMAFRTPCSWPTMVTAAPTLTVPHGRTL